MVQVPSHLHFNRELSSDSKNVSDESYLEIEELIKKRHGGILMNSEGSSKLILPGNYVTKTNKKTGLKKKVPVERELGHFWMLKVR